MVVGVWKWNQRVAAVVNVAMSMVVAAEFQGSSSEGYDGCDGCDGCYCDG